MMRRQRPSQTLILLALTLLPTAFLAACTDADQGLEPGEGFVEVTGGRVWYRIWGSGTATPLLALHGGPGFSSVYLKSLEGLSDERPVIIYDQLGSGHSEQPADTSLWHVARFVEELAQVREALGLERVHLLGHSWGSMLAAEYMLGNPEGVESVIMASPALSISRWLADAKQLLTTLPDSLQTTIEQHEAAGTTASVEYQDAVMEFYRRFLSRRDPWSLDTDSAFMQFNTVVYEKMWGPSEFTATGSLKTFERAESLRDLTVPVLFTAGRYDEATPETVAYYDSLTPDSRLVILENSAHLTMQDEPERYVEVVREFLAEIEARRR